MVYSLLSAIRNQCSLIHFAVIGLVAGPMVLVNPMAASASNEFRNCTGKLIDAGIDTALATSTCAAALHPRLVADCVQDVTWATEVEATDALTTCSRDRRPDEVAICVIDIVGLEGANVATALNNCGKSVLPVRYADCVLGLTAASDLVADQSMAQCIAAGYRPVDVAPTFIFAN
jgi:hypothetical protein